MSNDTLIWFVPLGISIVGGVVTYASTSGVVKQKLKNLEDDAKDAKAQLRELRDKAVACETILKERGPVVQSNSPLNLTERGRTLLNDSGGAEYIEKKKDELIKVISERKPKSAYDVQEYASQVIRDRSNLEDFVPLKDYLYVKGEPLENLVSAMGVALRDVALPKLGFNIDDLDKNV